MIIKTDKTIPASEITDPLVFQQRRKIIKALLASALLPAGIVPVSANTELQPRWPEPTDSTDSGGLGPTTPAELVKNYTNYYEFSFNKEDSTELAQRLPTANWTIEIGGEVEKPGHYQLEDILSRQTLREYVYRFRCVEAWSMVVPWVGFRWRSSSNGSNPCPAPSLLNLPRYMTRVACLSSVSMPC